MNDIPYENKKISYLPGSLAIVVDDSFGLLNRKALCHIKQNTIILVLANGETLSTPNCLLILSSAGGTVVEMAYYNLRLII